MRLALLLAAALAGNAGIAGTAFAAHDCTTVKPKGDQPLDAEYLQASEADRPVILASTINYGMAVSDRVILDGLRGSNHELAVITAGHLWLKPEAVAVVLQLADDEVIANMLLTGCAPLSVAQIDTLITRQLKRDGGKQGKDKDKGKDRDAVLRALLRGDAYAPALTAAQTQRMAGSSDLLVKLRLAERNPDSDNLALVRAIVNKQGPDAWPAVHPLAVVPADIVDAMLSHPSEYTRREFVKEGRFQPTPAQQERILTDADKYVGIIFLGRKQVTLTEAQWQRGLSHPDSGVQYAYKSKLDREPRSKP
jgi:hypothetical protein